MNPQILNLDDLVKPTKSIQLDGQTHQAKEMTVEDYVNRVKRAGEIKARTESGENSQTQNVDDAIEFLSGVFPSLTKERLRRLTMAQLSALIEFAIAAPEDIANAVNQTNENSSSEKNE